MKYTIPIQIDFGIYFAHTFINQNRYADRWDIVLWKLFLI